jgi:hypothetical protein
MNILYIILAHNNLQCEDLDGLVFECLTLVEHFKSRMMLLSIIFLQN